MWEAISLDTILVKWTCHALSAASTKNYSHLCMIVFQMPFPVRMKFSALPRYSSSASLFLFQRVTGHLVTIAFPAVPFWRSPSLAPRRPQARSKSSGPTSTGNPDDSYDWQVSMPFLFLIVILFGPVVHSGSVFMCSWVNYRYCRLLLFHAFSVSLHLSAVWSLQTIRFLRNIN